MKEGIIYDCPNVNCTTPIYTGKCRKDCYERYNKEMGKKLKTNADHIRSMSDEELAEFFIVRDAMKKMYGTYPSRTNEIEEVTKIAWLNWLKQPYEEKEE